MIGTPAIDGSDALARAAREIAATATGPLATSIAVISVAAIGFLVMTGRLPVRRSLTVILGCFIIFGASTIAAALADLARGASGPVIVPIARPASPIAKPQLSPQPSPRYDPYAGASVPPR